MSMPFYVSPEQVMKDRADYARKGIARGRALVGLVYADGVLIVAENPSRTLHKVSEIYDRIAFAGVGKYSEFEALRKVGVREADTRGYHYSREDVVGRSLADYYAQTLNHIFTHEMKPLEVEILVAEVGRGAADDQLYRIQYDGVVFDEIGFTVIGGDADAVTERVKEGYRDSMSLEDALRTAMSALAGPDRTLSVGELEVAVLTRGGAGRTFRRIEDAELGALVGQPDEASRAHAPGESASAE